MSETAIHKRQPESTTAGVGRDAGEGHALRATGCGAMAAAEARLRAMFARRWMLVLVALAALVSTAIGVHHSLVWAMDFQWPAATLLVHGHDPWLEALRSHRDLTHSASVPNYLHELYVLSLPLTLLPQTAARAVWMLVNIALTLLSLWMLGAIYNIPRRQLGVLLLVFAAGISFRSGLGAGQFCFAELFFFCLVYRYPLRWGTRGAALGLSLAKYSFSPVIGIVFLLRRRWRALLVAALPPLVGLGVCMWMLHRSWYPLAVEPLLVARRGVSPGYADLMTLGERLVSPRLGAAADAVALALAVLYALRLGRRRRLAPGGEFACVAVASLFFFKHLIYDYVFLLAPLAYSLWGNALQAWARRTVLVLTAYVWFVTPLYISLVHVRDRLPLLLFNCLCMAALLIAVDCGQTERERSRDGEEAHRMRRTGREHLPLGRAKAET